MSRHPLDDLRRLSDKIVEAEKKYYDLDYEYRKVVDKIRYMEADLLVNGELTGKTLREREAEAQLHTASLQNDKRRLFYEANLAKADKEFLERKYQIELLAANEFVSKS